MAEGSQGLAPHSQRAVRELIAESATRNERALCLMRIVLITLSGARAFWVWASIEGGMTPGHALFSLGQSGFILVFCGWLFLHLRTHTASRGLLWASVLHDAVLCFLALIQNPLWPAPEYPGLLLMPDLAWLILITAIAGLRLSISAAVLASVLNVLSFIALISLDEWLIEPATPPNAPLSVWTILLLATGIFTVVLAMRIRSVVTAGALRALEAERAERSLGALMEDHHDVRTLLSAASLNADLLAHRLTELDGSAADPELLSLTGELQADLTEINAFVAEIRERAHGELTALQTPLPVELGKVAQSLAGELGPRLPDCEVSIDPSCHGALVWTPAGEATLRRVLFNLIVNAFEGNGHRGARRVEIAGEPARDGAALRILVRDDGPGFPAETLRAPIGSRVTTKARGSGLGLVVVETLLAASAETLARANRRGGGAEVSFELPAVL